MTISFVRFQLPAFIWAILIFTASSFPVPDAGVWEIQFADKWAHLLVYGVLGWLTARALLNQSRLLSWQQQIVLFATILGTAYGILDEVHQAFVPGRFPDPIDALADAVGAWLGALLFARSRWAKPQ